MQPGRRAWSFPLGTAQSNRETETHRVTYCRRREIHGETVRGDSYPFRADSERQSGRRREQRTGAHSVTAAESGTGKQRDSEKGSERQRESFTGRRCL